MPPGALYKAKALAVLLAAGTAKPSANAPPVLDRGRGFSMGKHGRRNTRRVDPVERNVPMIGRIIEAAYGTPENGKIGDLAASRIGANDKAAKYLLDRLPAHMALLEQHGCHRNGKPACSTCPIRKLCAFWGARHNEEKSGAKIIDLFCGAGGMSLGFENAGYVSALAVDLDLDAILTYRANRPWTNDQGARCANIVDLLKNGEFRKMAGTIDGVIGGPPCQTFSLVGYRTKKLDDRAATITADTRTWLPVKMAEVIAAVKPEFCVMENVAGFMSALNGTIRKATMDRIVAAGYSITEAKVRAEKHGAPQYRWRYMLIGIRNAAVGGKRRAQALVDEIGEILTEGTQEPTSMDDALEVLSPFGEIGPGKGAEFLQSGKLQTWNHYARTHNSRDLAIYAALGPGETADDLENRKPGSIPYALSSFHDKYRKLDGSRPSPTIPAHLRRDANSFVRDGVNRGLTPREAATLQGFPIDYMFLGEQSHQFQQIGNAVPPIVAQTVAELVRDSIKKGKDPKWQPTLVRGSGKRPSKETLVIRKQVILLKRSKKLPELPEFLHWSARRLQLPKKRIKAMVAREYRDPLNA